MRTLEGQRISDFQQPEDEAENSVSITRKGPPASRHDRVAAIAVAPNLLVVLTM